MNKKLVAIPTLILVGALASFSLSTTASAAGLGLNVQADTAITGQNPGGPMIHVGATTNTSSTSGEHNGQWMQHAMSNGIFGTVTAINGNTITVQSKMFTRNTSATSTTAPSTSSTSTTYTVDATNAKVDKDRVASSVSNIAVGDNIVVVGAVSGTNVTATTIHDALALNGGAKGANGSATTFTSNGQPVIGGTVTAVNGDTVTITNKSNTSYTIDVTNAKINKNGTTSTASNIAVGDSIIAQGTVNGTSVTAVNVMDSVNTTTTTNGTTTHKGFFGAIGDFFAKLF